jgi:hypothetical protein
MSTQNGFNLFYKLWKGATEKSNIYAPFKVDWYQVPQYNKKTKQWEKRTDEWKNMMVGILGSEEAFYYQYGTQFSASDKCLVSRETLSKIRDNTILFEKNDEFEITAQYRDKLYWKPGYEYLPYAWYVLLIDLAEGGGGDYTVFNIIEVTAKDKFEQVGYWRSNNVDLEHAALEFWLIAGQLFNTDHCIWSIEWNTYGALFYTYLTALNDDDMFQESLWRFNVIPDGIDLSQIVWYKKQSIDETAPGVFKNSKQLPGIRFNSSNKITACSLLKMMFEHGDVILTDIVTVGELENFEDKNGNGTYKASIGHDDIIMTFAQLPMLKQTAKYKEFIEEYEMNNYASDNMQDTSDFINPYGIY